MLNRKTSTSSCTDKFLAMCSAVSEVLASFRAPARGIRFYDVPLGDVKEELRFRCELEPFNARDANSICLKCSPLILHLRAPPEGGFSSLSALAPSWISC